MKANLKKIKKTLFPFYKKEYHKFLMSKWQFRLLIVIYTILFVVAPFVIWFWYVSQSSDWCYDSLYLYYDNQSLFNMELEACVKIAREAAINGIFIAILGWLLGHYFIQVTFFKVIIDYIVLGGKRK